MSRMFQQPEPPKKSFMEQMGWSTISGVLVGIIVFILTAWIIKVQVVDFSWAMLIFGCVMLGITVFCVRYIVTAKRRLQEQFQKDLAASKKEFRAAQDNLIDMTSKETNRLNEWAINFSQASDKEHRERTEELKHQCMEAIRDAEQRLDGGVKNSLSIFKGSVESQQIVVDLYRQQLIQVQKEVKELRENREKVLPPEDPE